MEETHSIHCPNCGAPLHVTGEQTLAICLYCNSSVRITPPPQPDGQSSPPQASVHDIPQEVIETVKQMVVEGKRFQAVAYYQEQAGLTHAEADFAVSQIVLPLVFKMTHQVPLTALGIGMVMSIVILAAAGLVLSIHQMANGQSWFFLVAALCVLLLYERIRFLAPKLRSTWVASRGALGNARILKRAIVRSKMMRDGALVLLLMEVTPDDGQPAFTDEESVLVLEKSLPKVQAGNTIRVRFDAPKQDRVFPVAPIEVIEWAAVPPEEDEKGEL